jgi:hypothetical protein
LPILLGHDHDPQWLRTSAASPEISSIIGCHRPGRLLMLQAFHHKVWPPMAQHVLHLPAIDSLVRDHHCHVVTAYHAGEADFAPSPLASRHSISHIAKPASEPLDAIA